MSTTGATVNTTNAVSLADEEGVKQVLVTRSSACGTSSTISRGSGRPGAIATG